jgi:hypothetical protein
VRNRRATFAAFVTLALGLVLPSAAYAGGGMDPTPERLVVQPPGLPPGQTCQTVAANPGALVAAGLRPQDFPCRPDHAAFANMVSELGFAIAPTAFYPARTTGIGGFQVTFEASYTRINANTGTGPGATPYWKLGTRGSQDPNTNNFSIIDNSPDSLLQIYAIKARKGLPLGFELAGSLGYIANTTLWVGGGDIRWALLEGFRQGALGILPDISVGGGVRTLTGTSKFFLTTVGIDVKASKPIALADSAQLIPSIGYQRVIIFGDSNVLDATPNVDALAQCGYEGSDPVTGNPQCRNKLPNGADNSADFANNFTFHKVRVHRNRGIIGLNYKYELVWLGSQFAFDINDPKDENPLIVGNRQWTLSFEAGVSF